MSDGSSHHESPVRTPRWRWVGAGLLLVVVDLLAFGGVVEFGWVAWDDPLHVWLNPVVREWSGVSWYRRLMTPALGYPSAVPVGVYALFWDLFGEQSARPIHAFCLVVHVGNALLVWRLVLEWFDSRTVGWWAALFWSTHPVVVEGVAWVSNLKELTMTVFLLAALVAWERCLDDDSSGGWAALFGVTVLLGLWTKPTFVVVAPLATFRFWYRGEHDSTATSVWRWVLGGTWVVVLAWTAHFASSYASFLGEGAAKFEARSYGVTILKALGLQVRNYAYPFHLEPYYPFDLIHFDVYALVGLVTLLAGSVATLWAIWRRSVAATPLVFASVAYAPYSNLRPLPRFTADTYTYLPSIGVAALLALGVETLRRGLADRGHRRWLATAAAGCLVAGWTSLSAAQVQRWRSTEALFEPLLGEPHKFALPYTLVAYEKYRIGEVEPAVDLLDRAWPRLQETRELPRFAPRAYVEAGRLERAAAARLHVADRYAEDREGWVRALEFLVRHDLPRPEGEAAELFRRAVRAWRGAPQRVKKLSVEEVDSYLASP